MSDETTPAEQPANETVETPTVTPEQFAELKQQFEQLSASKERILAESKEYKQKLQSLKAEREAADKEALAEAGKFEELYQKETVRAKNLENQHKELRDSMILKELRFQVAKHAPDARNLDDVLDNLKHYSEIVKVDRENLQVSGVEEAVAKLKQDKNWFFHTEKDSGMVDSRPKTSKPVDVTVDNWDSLDEVQKSQLGTDALAKFLS